MREGKNCRVVECLSAGFSCDRANIALHWNVLLTVFEALFERVSDSKAISFKPCQGKERNTVLCSLDSFSLPLSP